MADTTWTKELVQLHAQDAAAVELYTLPFYLTTLTSIKDTTDPTYKAILSVCMEEMLHLQLAANLCLALDTNPNFAVPHYGTPIQFLKPDDPETNHYALINAQLDALNETTLQMMLDIETPTEFEDKTQDHTTPQYPYNTLGEMYDALLFGIQSVGIDQFSWTTTNQQAFWSDEKFKQKISNLSDAKNAVMVINEQGEGKTMSPVPQMPFKEGDFPIPTDYRLSKEHLDPKTINQYAHYGRFIWIQNQVNKKGFPEVYAVQNGAEQQSVLTTLQSDFADLVKDLNELWSGDSSSSIWGMTALIGDAKKCWQAGVVPKWS
ncbi:hypothetical protein Lepto7375DRAFT_1132 [Leptolyngbya sp. PCC 7375]|nr:hypothetical protein Lepto7375DRAFT_1132 [Leptolyngbya sp. PCC 7375]